MKKIIYILALLFMLISCTSRTFGDFTQSFFGEKLTNLTEAEKFERKMRDYKLSAEIETTKGKLNVILYPDAAPYNTAHFVYLATHDFYNNMNFHRVLPSALVQFGDDSINHDGTGTGGPLLDDEIVSWLDFSTSGIFAMANQSLKNTNGSQVFITLAPINELNGQYTIIGELSSKDDLSKARLIRTDDKILSIKISGNNVDDFLNNFNSEFSKWSGK